MKYLHALNKIDGIGSQKIKKLLSFFNNDSENIWHATYSDLQIALGDGKLPEKIINARKKINPEKEWAYLEKENIHITSLADESYPKLLKEICNPPHLIYLKGNLNLNETPSIAIVGARKHSPYGAQATVAFSRNLAKSGLSIVSGLALGIDAIAHKSALDVNEKTIAVLGSSIDNKNIYPRTNFQLAQEIITKNGTLLSEYPPETSATAFTFPARNRIIAGLAMGTLVVEAGEKSGALITARLALENNREVFAIPGSIFSENSIGTNNLIKTGAKLIMNISDILEELHFSQTTSTIKTCKKITDNKDEATILNILSDKPLHIDNIGKISKLGTAMTTSILTMMEIKGWVKNIGGQNYILL
jgi:DNA processing protein